MAVAWDKLYDPLESAYLGPQEAFDKQGHHVVIHHHHHHHHHHQCPHSQSYTNGGQYTSNNETHITTTAAVPWMPPSNIYETNLAYHIDVEVPGVVNITSFQIQWPNLSTLMIEAKATPQPLVHCGREENGGTIREEKKEAENAVANMNSKSKSDDDGGGVLHHFDDTAEERVMRIVLEERKLGSWRRSFTLPTDVDMKTAKADVEFGLLHISALKKNNAGDDVVEL